MSNPCVTSQQEEGQIGFLSGRIKKFILKQCACYVNAVGHIISHKHKGEGMEEEGRSEATYGYGIHMAK